MVGRVEQSDAVWAQVCLERIAIIYTEGWYWYGKRWDVDVVNLSLKGDGATSLIVGLLD